MNRSRVLSATAVGIVVGAPVAISVGPLSVRWCRVGSDVVRVQLRVVVDLYSSDGSASRVDHFSGCQFIRTTPLSQLPA